MEHRPRVCETLVQVNPTAAATATSIQLCVAPCERPFHASCTHNKLPVADDDVTCSKNRSMALDEAIPLPPSADLYAQPNEELLLPSTADVEYDCLIEDLTDYIEIIEDLILSLLRRITMLPFISKNKEIFVKIAMVF
ncbi:hypothetical protein X777_02541 [Ooceraea biroi]|uniref:Uncharacterized protein n=1 Tax=Ooceraea biroi TaxID=2015173 RepID=A0A026WMN1_OOCBI|nr:hypothetical protein X777_02541 [Ooceraea biroi]